MEAVDLKNGNLKSIYMVFSNVLLFILVCYAIYYVANITYDMFFRKENVEIVPKVDEEEVDISDLAETFQPVSIVKDAPTVKWDDPIYDEEKDAEVEAMVKLLRKKTRNRLKRLKAWLQALLMTTAFRRPKVMMQAIPVKTLKT